MILRVRSEQHRPAGERVKHCSTLHDSQWNLQVALAGCYVPGHGVTTIKRASICQFREMFGDSTEPTMVIIDIDGTS